jgi:hypothetical protein
MPLRLSLAGLAERVFSLIFLEYNSRRNFFFPRLPNLTFQTWHFGPLLTPALHRHRPSPVPRTYLL